MTNTVSSASKEPSQFKSMSLADWGEKFTSLSGDNFVKEAKDKGFIASSDGNVLVRAAGDNKNKAFEMFIRDTTKKGEDQWVKMTTTRPVSKDNLKVVNQVCREARAIFNLSKEGDLAERLNHIGQGAGTIQTKMKSRLFGANIIRIKNSHNYEDIGKQIIDKKTNSIFFSIFATFKQPDPMKIGKDWFKQEAKKNSKEHKIDADKMTKISLKKQKNTTLSPGLSTPPSPPLNLSSQIPPALTSENQIKILKTEMEAQEKKLEDTKQAIQKDESIIKQQAMTKTYSTESHKAQKRLATLQEQKEEIEQNLVNIKNSITKEIQALEQKIKTEKSSLLEIENDIENCQNKITGKEILPPSGNTNTSDVVEILGLYQKNKEKIEQNITDMEKNLAELKTITPLSSPSETPQSSKTKTPTLEQLEKQVQTLEKKIETQNNRIKNPANSTKDKDKLQKKIKEYEDSKTKIEKEIATLQEKQRNDKTENQI